MPEAYAEVRDVTPAADDLDSHGGSPGEGFPSAQIAASHYGERFMPVPISEVNEIINREAAGDASLITALEEIQERLRYLPPEALILASERFGLPLSQTYSVATFYNAFSLKPKGKHCLTVCMGTACHVRGSPQVLERLESKLAVQAGDTTPDSLFTLETINCLGACALGPIVVSDGEYSGQMTTRKADMLLKRMLRAEAQA